MEIGYGSDAKMQQTIGCRDVQPTIEDRLLRRKNQLEADLKDVNDALDGLKANPEVATVLRLISKVNY